ncbi:MAG: beta-lactamase family protein [Deltaproteobacteria bacterium]|nr:beta-lactamase family protein [Deltaproteobacteria bacterium]
MTQSPHSPAASVPHPDPSLPKTIAAFEMGRKQGLHRGGQIYLSLHGKMVSNLALGEAREGKAMTSETPMIWLSATKPLTAVAIAKLWERGLLDLDDPIARHVPEFAAKGKERITLRHALTHTGGFRLLNLGWPQATWEEVIDRICQARPEPRWDLGVTAGYHLASSWFLLGEVVQRVGGLPFSQFLRQEIFEPLGMSRSWIGLPMGEFDALEPEIAVMDNTESQVAQHFPWHKAPYLVNPNPGANGCGPMRDLGRFYEMLLQRGRSGGKTFLTPQTVESLTCPHRVGLYDKTFKAMLDWGLGLIVNSEHYNSGHDISGQDRADQLDDPIVPYGYGRHASRRTFGHSGRRSSVAFADPEQGLVVALAVNGLPDESRHRLRMRSLTEAIYQDLGLA